MCIFALDSLTLQIQIEWASILDMLLKRDADQLTAGTHSGLGEQLLEHGFDLTLRDIKPGGDLLVGLALEDAFEHGLFPFIEYRGSPRLDFV